MTPTDSPTEAPPTGEELHLPGPSAIPLINAFGLAVAIVGLTAGVAVIAAGLLLFVITTAMWIRDVVRDIGDLPPDHSSH